MTGRKPLVLLASALGAAGAVALALVLAMSWPASLAGASSRGAAGPGLADPLGTWSSTAFCTGCGAYAHTTVIGTFAASTGVFTGTDTNGSLTGTVQGGTFTMRAGYLGGGYGFTLKGTIKGGTWVGTWTDNAGHSGTWAGKRIAGGGKLLRPSPSPGAHAPTGSVGSIASSLPAPSKAFSPLKSDIVNAAITLGLALFLTFPSNLFNSTFEENYDDILAWSQKWASLFFPVAVRRALSRAARKVASLVLSALGLAGRSKAQKLEREKVGFWLVLLAGAVLGSLLDPAFGLNVRTVLSFVAIAIAMVAGVFLSGLITAGYHRAKKHGKVAYKLESLPGGLVIAAACVIISRSTGFAPGYLYGVICGVSFARQLAKHEEGHVIALGSVIRVALAIVAWLAWAVLTNDAAKPGSFFGKVLLDDFLASLFVSSLVGTLISLFPLRFLPGHKLQAWHKGVWAATFGITLFVLVQVLLRPHSTSRPGPSHTPLVTTVVLFAAFGIGSVLFRDHFARKHRRAIAVASVAVAGETSVRADGHPSPAEGTTAQH